MNDNPKEVPTSRLGRLWKSGRAGAGLAAAMLGRGTSDSDLEALNAVVSRLGELRGLATKGGQILSYVDPSLPPELRAALAVLQTAARASDPAQIEATVRGAFGARADALLARMDKTPVAVASIGQVHRGVLPDGAEVAIKIRHPGIEQAIVGDFATAGAGSGFARLLMPGSTVGSFVTEARTAILEECDFLLEARRQATFAKLFAGDATIAVPGVAEAWCAPAVLTTQWLPGRTLAQLLASNPSQAERDRLGVALFRFYVGTLYQHGLFHADPHPGNYGFREDGRLVIYDFGCVREFPPQVVRALAAMILAVRRDDAAAMRDALEAFGGEPPRDREAVQHVRLLLRAFFAPMIHPGARRMEPGQNVETRQLLKDKRAAMRLKLPGRLLFLFRLRFGVCSVISQLGACADWAALESGWAEASSSLQ